MRMIPSPTSSTARMGTGKRRSDERPSLDPLRARAIIGQSALATLLAGSNLVGHSGRGPGDHPAGYYYNLPGQAPGPSFRTLLNNRKPLASDWPFMGSVVAYKRPPHPGLPSLITLPQKPGFPEY